MPSYLVTGVAGFVGSNIARALLKKSTSIRGIDNFSTGKPANLEDLHDLDFIQGDLLDRETVARVCKGIDVVFHQAAIPSVPKSVQQPVPSHDSNINGTFNLLLAAREAGVKRVIYASSSSVYGETPTLPKREEMAPDPISPYAVQKLTGEQYMKSFCRVYGLETISLRYFNVFGPYQAADSMYSGVLAKFSMLMLNGEAPTVFGDGEQTRDFTFIDNVVDANLNASEAPAGDVAGQSFNIATGKRITLNETLKILRGITGYKGPVNYAPAREGDIKHSLADISLANKYLGYKPTISFAEGLQRTVSWYKKTAAASA